MEFNETDNRKVYCFDVDGILTNGEPFWETEPTPNIKYIEKLKEFYKSGNIIIIHTARAWEYANLTVGWLIKHKIPFHGIMMQKGGTDYYIDDKAINHKEFIK